MKSDMLERLADRLCTCGYLLPSVHAVEPEAHHEDCPYRVLFSIGLYHNVDSQFILALRYMFFESGFYRMVESAKQAIADRHGQQDSVSALGG